MRWRRVGVGKRRGHVEEGVNGDGRHVVGVLVLCSAGGGLFRAHHRSELHSLRTRL